VTKGDITSSITVTGTVTADPAATVKATATGTVSKVHAKAGAAVKKGTKLFDVRVPLEPTEEKVVTAPDGTVTTTPPRDRFKTVTVTAGSTGRLASLSVLLDQEVSVGTDVATVSPGTLSVNAPLTQAQQFRLLKPPATASAQAPGGPAPFGCTHVRTGAAEDDTEQPAIDPYTGMPQEASTAQVSCRVPAGTTVFAGMSVDLTIDTGSAKGVLLVPVSAVLGSIGEGKVWVMGEDGEATERAVTLGLTDGEQVEVTKGVAEGDQVLQFTPVPLDDEPQPGEEMFG
jgi:multidrug efflux pump subunit AcrA (membrane-fusion protein)